jgi:hypothetical protein
MKNKLTAVIKVVFFSILLYACGAEVKTNDAGSVDSTEIEPVVDSAAPVDIEEALPPPPPPSSIDKDRSLQRGDSANAEKGKTTKQKAEVKKTQAVNQ